MLTYYMYTYNMLALMLLNLENNYPIKAFLIRVVFKSHNGGCCPGNFKAVPFQFYYRVLSL